MTDKLLLTFNPDSMTGFQTREAVDILRALIHRREMLQAQCSGDVDMIAGSFLNSFDTLTQNVSTYMVEK